MSYCTLLVGLVEIITESETLRKIQVKHGHGLAGSFKDRPIAEWLQMQNPTELEYQKASQNYLLMKIPETCRIKTERKLSRLKISR